MTPPPEKENGAVNICVHKYKMNNNDPKQLQTLTTTVNRLERTVSVLERRIVQLERQNKKLHSSLIAAQARISSLIASMESVKSRLNNR